MGVDIRETIARVDAITSVEDAEQLEILDQSSKDFFTNPDAGVAVAVWFRLFERFPEDDAYGVFWSILHGIEGLAGYDEELIASIRRRPSEFTVLMVNRMINAGQMSVGDTDLLCLLEEVADDEACPTGVRLDARKFVEYQRNRN
jgi:hypothetical protein